MMSKLAFGLGLLAATSLVACSSGPSTSVGANAPAFSSVDLHGNPKSLAAYEGKTLILDFWAVW